MCHISLIAFIQKIGNSSEVALLLPKYWVYKTRHYTNHAPLLCEKPKTTGTSALAGMNLPWFDRLQNFEEHIVQLLYCDPWQDIWLLLHLLPTKCTPSYMHFHSQIAKYMNQITVQQMSKQNDNP